MHVNLRFVNFLEKYSASGTYDAENQVFTLVFPSRGGSYDFRRDDLKAARKWSLDEVWVYPPPHNVGLTLDPRRGDRVRRDHGRR